VSNKRKTRVGTALLMLLALCLGHSFAETPEAENQSRGEATLPDAPSVGLTDFSNLRQAPELVFESSYHLTPAPATPDERLRRFLQNSFFPEALRGNLFDAVQAQFQKAWPEYGRGLSGFERRYFVISAGHVANSFFGTYLFPTLLHQTPRSPRLGTGSSLWRRLGYAVSRVAVTRDDNGNRTLNSSLLLSTVASNAARNLYYPRDQRGPVATIAGIEGSLIGSLQGNLSREFMPDIQQFLWKHAPARLQRLAHRLPFSTKWQPAEVLEIPQEARQ
jgi:hypothetical protein